MGYVKSRDLSPEKLVVECKLDGCDKRFATDNGMKNHYARVHIYNSYPERKDIQKIADGETKCSNCEKEFNNTTSLRAHGSPEACKKRIAKSWKTFICQNPECKKEYTKYVGPKKDKKGQKFCSRECSGKAQNRPYPRLKLVSKICKNISCKKEFETKIDKQKFCSKQCAKNYNGYVVKDSSKMGGPRDGGGHSKLIAYTNRFGEEMKLNKEEIEVAEFLDTTEYTWSRNWKGFSYTDLEGKPRKFYPDFYVKNLDLYIEYKGWITDKMDHKMKEAQLKNDDLKLLIVVGRNKRFLHMGVPLDDLLNGSYTL